MKYSKTNDNDKVEDGTESFNVYDEQLNTELSDNQKRAPFKVADIRDNTMTPDIQID